jgi:prepilin-type N-terminal cleavage/methylation domain-containing protein
MFRSSAFTLIEVMLTIAIMGLLASAAAWNFSGPLHRARTVEAIEQLKYLDASSRDLARRFGQSVEIAFDLDENTIERRDRAGGDATFHTAIASPLRIEAVWMNSQRSDDGEVTIPVSALGVSPTYAVKLSGPEGQRWILMTGLGGESATYRDDTQIEAIFSKITSRHDAD